jgi:hypothetical protein
MPPAPTIPDPRRISMRLPRPLWIGLAGAMLLVGAVGLGIGVRIWRQFAAVRAIERQGGVIGTVHHLSGWQRQWLGQPAYKVLEEVEFVNWEHHPITDATLDQLLALQTLRRLNLRRTRVTDAGIARLKDLPRLELLLLDGTDVTESGIGELQKSLPALRIQK